LSGVYDRCLAQRASNREQPVYLYRQACACSVGRVLLMFWSYNMPFEVRLLCTDHRLSSSHQDMVVGAGGAFGLVRGGSASVWQDC